MKKVLILLCLFISFGLSAQTRPTGEEGVGPKKSPKELMEIISRAVYANNSKCGHTNVNVHARNTKEFIGELITVFLFDTMMTISNALDPHSLGIVKTKTQIPFCRARSVPFATCLLAGVEEELFWFTQHPKVESYLIKDEKMTEFEVKNALEMLRKMNPKKYMPTNIKKGNWDPAA